MKLIRATKVVRKRQGLPIDIPSQAPKSRRDGADGARDASPDVVGRTVELHPSGT